MLIVTLTVEAPPGTDLQGVKEALAMNLEKYGGVRVIRVEERGVKQCRMEQVIAAQTDLNL